MKFLFVLEFYHPHIGGVESLFKKIVDSLADRGHHITVLTNKHDTDLPSIEENRNIIVKRVAYGNRYAFTFLAWFHAFKLSKDVDFIHTTSYNAAIPAWIAAKLRRKEIIITFHEYWGLLWDELPWMSGFSKWLHALFERILVKLDFDQFVAVSEYTKDELIRAGVSSNKVTRIYNGIDYIDWAKHQPLVNSDYIFTYFGRVGYSKGLDLLIPAIAEIKRKDINCRFQLIVSKGPLFQTLIDLIEQYDVLDRITFFHELEFEQLQNKIAESNAVIIPSYSEGFCFAAVETMAIGTPIISSDRGALAEVVSGPYLKLDELKIDNLVDAIEKARVGEWVYSPPKRFSLDKTIEEYIELYKRLLVT